MDLFSPRKRNFPQQSTVHILTDEMAEFDIVKYLQALGRKRRSKLLKMNQKFRCLWRLAQSGKTRKIQEWIRENQEFSNHLNIVICSNNRLLVAQTQSRMRKDMYSSDDDSSSTDGESVIDDEEGPSDDHIENKVFSWMSGTKKTNISVGELADFVKEDEVEMVVCCSHKRRFEYINELLKNLDKSKKFHKRISIWIDEADSSVKIWSKEKYDFSKYNRVDRVVLVSATFMRIVKMFDGLNVRGYPDSHPETYMKLTDCNFVHHESNTSTALGYITEVIEDHPSLCEPGVILFAPGDVETDSHDAITEYLHSRGFAVLVLNGRRKEVVLPDGTTIEIRLNFNGPAPDELKDILANIYTEYGLHEFPFAITGQICLGRGITFQSSDFRFTHGIIPLIIDDCDDMYQLIARLLGNIKFGENQTGATIYTSQYVEQMTKAAEKIANNVSRLVMEKNWSTVSADEIAYAAHEDDSKLEADKRKQAVRQCHDNAVAELEEFSEWKPLSDRYHHLWNLANEKKTQKNFTYARIPNKNADGRYVCSIGNKSEVQTADSIREKFGDNGLQNWGSGLTVAQPGDFVHRIYAGYDGDKVIYFLRWTVIPEIEEVQSVSVPMSE